MYDVNTAKKWTIVLALALFPLAALIVAETTDRPLSALVGLVATIAATMMLSLAVGLFLMISGFVVALFGRENEAAKWFIGIGACMVIVAFISFCLIAIGYAIVELLGLRAP